MEPKSSPALTLPSAIVIAAAMIAISLIYLKGPAPAAPAAAGDTLPNMQGINMKPVSDDDHIFGNPQAPIKIIEYSDPSCPFCKTHHPTLVRLMEEYGPTGKVAWVYRHFPLDKPNANGFVLHPKANNEAQSFECAAEVGGNDKFWEYINKFYEVTPAVTSQTPEGLDPAEIPKIAQSVELDVTAFNACLASGKYKKKIDDHYLDGINAGVAGTPHNIVITPSGNKIPLQGAVEFYTLKSTIETLLSEIK